MKRPLRYYANRVARGIGIAVTAGLGAAVLVMSVQRIFNGGAW